MNQRILESVEPGSERTLKPMGTWPQSRHQFEKDAIWAVRAAWAARRPLLIQGEPGCGKSQLARAVAQVENWAFIPAVIHHRSECTDLQWHFDAVARLGSAQLLGYQAAAVRQATAAGKTVPQTQTHGEPCDPPLDPHRFLSPGPLWWTVNWVSARKQREACDAGLQHAQPITSHIKEPDPIPKGRVLLIDEIDKAHVDLPNGLLEVLDNGGFSVPYLADGFVAAEGQPPLVVITTNGERTMPQAFLRRCCVYTMAVPEDKDAFRAWLIKRAETHFAGQPRYFPEVAEEAAKVLWSVRCDARDAGQPKPGQGEYLDLMRALQDLADSCGAQIERLDDIAKFVIDKAQQVAP